MRRKTAFLGHLTSIVALFCCVVTVSGSLVAYDHFNYTTADGATLTGVTVNGGIGWDEPWQQGQDGIVGISVGSPARSLSFSQTPALIMDGSNHGFAKANAANRRNLATPVAANTTFFSLLIRSFTDGSQTGGGAQMRVEFFDGLNASGNMRANVGIDGNALFVSGNTTGYSPGTGATVADVFEDETTYLLVMKRTGSAIFASLIEADGDPATLESEPLWQVSHSSGTGVNFNSLRIIINGSDTSLRMDEFKVATTWEDAVSRANNPPEGLVATAGEGKARLEWSTVENASSYTVYRSMSADGTYQPVANIQLASFVDVGLDPESNYYYAVTATDADGLESSFSNIVSATPTGTLLSPQADAYVQNGPFFPNGNNTNYGTESQLLVRTVSSTFSSSTRHVYLRFDLSSLEGTVANASLRLRVASSDGSGDTHTLHAVADDSWGETSITWNNRPSTGSAIASAPSPGVGDWLVLDVTSQVAAELAGNQLFSSALISGGSSSVGYHSREATNADNRPVLLVTMREAPLPSSPSGLSATEDEAGRIQLSWNSQGAPGEFTYRIYRATQSGGPLVQLMDTDETTFTDKTADAGQSFFYWVATVNADGYASEPSLFAGLEPPLLRERFDYFDTNRLANGTANTGSGWAEGWQALSGGGLHILNRRIDQTAAAASARGIANPFSLGGPGSYYFAFFARTDANGAFSFRLKQALPGPYVRWAFSRNTDGSITIQGGAATQTSAPGVFAANKEYLVISKFDTNSDTASVKLIDPNAPGDYLNEPTVWDLSASSPTGVMINQLDIEASAGVMIDDIVIADSYAEVVRFMASEVPELLTPEEGASGPYAFPNFSWTEHREQFREMDAPVNYEIEIATDATFNSVIDRDYVGLPRYVHSHPLAQGGYFWRVRSLTAGGRVSEWSDVGSFEITGYDQTVTVNYDPQATDHTAAVQAAVAETATLAGQGNSVKLIFPPGDYHFGDQTISYIIDLPGVSDVAVEGTGANLYFVDHRQALMISEGSTKVSLSGFRVYYATGALRIQGTVTAVDPETSTVTLAVEPGYKDFETGTIRNQNIFLLLDPEIDGRQKTGSRSFYLAVPGSYSKNPDDTWQVTLDVSSTPEWEVGDRYVYHFRTGSSVLTSFHNSHGVTLYGLTLGGWGNMMIHSLEGSLANILHIDTFYQEGKWMVGNADGIHIRSHTVGPWIENTRIKGLGDDGIALYARPASMSSAKPSGRQNAAIFVNDFFNLEPGDEVAFFEPGPGTILLETRVVSVAPEGNTWLVEFEHTAPDGMTFDGPLREVTQVWNRSKSCGDFMVRDSRFINIRRYGAVFRSQRGIIENTQFIGSSTQSIIFTNEPQFPNGLYASEIILRNNRIADSGFVANWAPAINFLFRGDTSAPNTIGPRNLLIEDNILTDVGNTHIRMNHTRNVVVRNNRFFDGSSFTPANVNHSSSERIVVSMDDSSGGTPSAPTGLKASIAGEGVALEWDLGSDPNAARFSVYRAGDHDGPYTLLADNLLFSEYTDLTASSDSVYFYVVTATDIAGNESGFSDPVSVSLAAPSVPTGLSATEDEAGRIHLSWDSQGSPGQFTYRIYRATQPSGPLVHLTDTQETTFTDEDVVAGQSFFYWVAAVNSYGIESEPGVVASLDTTRVHEPFDYDDDILLEGGTANLGAGWASGWQALSGGGLRVLNGRIDQADAAGSSRGIARPFSLNGPGRYYLAFYASAEAGATFSFRLKQGLPGPYVRWAFSRNGDGSITIQGGTASQTSAPGVFAADKEYLVVSRFDTNGDIASVKLIDPDDVQNYFNEPAVWDLSASGATGVTINQLDVEAAGGVRMDDIVIAESYAEVVLAVNLRAQDGLLVREPFNYTVGDRLDDVGSGTGWGTNKWTATLNDGLFIGAGSLPIPDGAGLFPGGNHVRNNAQTSHRRSQRYFEEPISLGTTLYASFLFRWEEGGRFRIETRNDAGHFRLSVGVDTDGSFWTARDPTGGTKSVAEDPVEEGATYFVLLKNTSATVQAALFEVGKDTVPGDESEITWLTNSSQATGVSQDRLIITIGQGPAITGLDELRMGTTFESVTSYPEPPVAPDIEHASIALDSGDVVVTVSFNESGNDNYTLQFSTNLVEGVWMDAVTGVTESPVIFTNSTPAGFFRIRAQ